ncbi:iron(III) transport system substrate-binding protein [Salibacterium salarium]|uniref:extracellular solute-binding protein n=1 Tax=Salibacterium salarium TaxID=284579 RepID=UPI0027806A3E|nr:extracellular solute-binding protein [Salibacterium salarium]MDQ0297750.1 iron(III) transport system substrate-binding protein [Salibacterium salarium]
MIKQMVPFSLLVLLLVIGLSACGSMEDDAAENNQEEASQEEAITIYTSRDNDVDRELFSVFTEETGVEVNVTSGSDDELIGQLEKGNAPEADVYLSKDTTYLQQAQAEDALQAMETDVISAHIPESVRAENMEWVGLTKSPRVIVYNTGAVEQEALSTYEALGEEEWEGRVVGGTFDNVYNQSFVASLITINGTESTHAWVEDMVGNFSGERKDSERDKVEAVVAGDGDVAIVNSQYVQPSDDQVGVFFPNQETSGTHVHVSGAAVLEASSNPNAASDFIRFLTSEQAQEKWTQENGEYPLHSDVEPAEMLQSWGEWEEQDLTLAKRSENHSEAIMLMEEAGWN